MSYCRTLAIGNRPAPSWPVFGHPLVRVAQENVGNGVGPSWPGFGHPGRYHSESTGARPVVGSGAEFQPETHYVPLGSRTTTHTFLIESQSAKMLNDVHKVNFPNGEKNKEWTRPSSVPSR